MTVPTAAAAEVIASFGLPDAQRARDIDAVAGADWDAVLRFSENQHLTGFLVALVAAGGLELDPAKAVALDGAHNEAMTWVLHLERTLLQLGDRFESRGIRYRILKGTSFARLHYGDRSLRTFADIDLLVHGEDLASVIELLTADGGKTRFAEPRAGFLRRFGKGASVTLPDGVSVDVHRLLALGPFGLNLDPELLFRRETFVPIGGRLLPALALEERCLHACFHALLGHAVPRYVPLRDVAQTLTRMPVDLERLRHLARSARAEIVVARAVSVAWDTFGLSPDADAALWAQSYRPDPESRKMLDLYQGRARSSTGLAVGSLRVLPTWRDRIAFAAAALAPTREGRSESLPSRWRRGVASAQSARRTR